jgi:hypothetical protein
MGCSTNGIKCYDCLSDNSISLEWRSKKNALKEIIDKKCSVCGSENWHFTDEMGQ